MRDILAALLCSRGYVHIGAGDDPNDLFWYGPTLGVRPMIECLQYEMNREHGQPVPGFIPVMVSVADKTPYPVAAP